MKKMWQLLNYNKRKIKHYQKQVKQINQYYEEIKHLDLNDLQDVLKQHQLPKLQKKKRLNEKNLLSFKLKTFALIKQAVNLTLGLNYFDVQLIGGLVLSDKNIAEMKTGEGKTIVTLLPLINHLLHHVDAHVHVVTTNDYLAKRDYEYLKPVLDVFGISSAYNSKLNEDEIKTDYHNKKKHIFSHQVVFTSNNELVFDYLRSHTVKDKNSEYFENGLFDKALVIIDEVDSILIDEAKTPLILSEKQESNIHYLKEARSLMKTLIRAEKEIPIFLNSNDMVQFEYLKKLSKEEILELENLKQTDFFLDLERKNITLYENAYKKIEEHLIKQKLIENKEETYTHASIFIHYVNNAIMAEYALKKDKDYLVENDKIVVIDQNTGRKRETSQWRDGLHQAVELKENVSVSEINKIIGKITYQSYFNLYSFQCGMTGTAETEAYELNKIYGLDTIVIPTNLPIKRIDYSDKMYLNKESKYEHLLEFVLEKHQNNQPILIGSPFVYVSEEIAKIFDENGLKYDILNAKNHEKEAQIIQNAGRLNKITISTNMAGRGTDIKLGGDINHFVNKIHHLFDLMNEKHNKKDYIKSLGLPDDYEKMLILLSEGKIIFDDVLLSFDKENALKLVQDKWQKEHDEVLSKGGLCVIGAGKNMNRRIDNQLRGRAGRQGEVGESVFFTSLDDELFTYGLKPEMVDKAKRIFAKIGLSEDMGSDLSGMQDKLFTQSQQKMEQFAFENRKYHYEFDLVLNQQREVFYQWRKEILHANEEEMRKTIKNDFKNYFDKLVEKETQNKDLNTMDFKDVLNVYEAVLMKVNAYTEKSLKEHFDKEIKSLLNGFNDFNKSTHKVRINDDMDYQEIDNRCFEMMMFIYDSRWAGLRAIEGNMIDVHFCQKALLFLMDAKWSEHLDGLEFVRKSANFSVLAQKEPLREFKFNAFQSFQEMVADIGLSFVEDVLKEALDKNLMEIEQIQHLKIDDDLTDSKYLKAANGALLTELIKTEVVKQINEGIKSNQS